MLWLLGTRTGFTLEALRQLRNPHLFKWYAVALLAFAVYAYAVEVERRRWDVIAAGLLRRSLVSRLGRQCGSSRYLAEFRSAFRIM